MNPSPPRVRVQGLVDALELWHTKGAVGQPPSFLGKSMYKNRSEDACSNRVDGHVENMYFMEKPVSVIQFPLPFQQIGFSLLERRPFPPLKELSKSGREKLGMS